MLGCYFVGLNYVQHLLVICDVLELFLVKCENKEGLHYLNLCSKRGGGGVVRCEILLPLSSPMNQQQRQSCRRVSFPVISADTDHWIQAYLVVASGTKDMGMCLGVPRGHTSCTKIHSLHSEKTLSVLFLQE